MDHGDEFVNSLDSEGVDVLVIAGDMTTGRGIVSALDLFCTRYKNSHVLYVHGNHEYYGTQRNVVLSETKKAVEMFDNLTWLDGNSVTIGDRTFRGATLWFPEYVSNGDKPRSYEVKRKLNDFSVIPKFEEWVYEEHERHAAYLALATQ